MGIGVEIFDAGKVLIDAAGAKIDSGLAEVGADPDDPTGLINLQLLAFQFTNTISSITGVLQSVSSATQSASQKIGQ